MSRTLTPALASLLLACAPLAAEEAGATPPPAPPATEGQPSGPLTAEQQQFWDDYLAKSGMAADEARAQSQFWVQQARSLLQKALFIEAKEAVDKAVALDPYNHEAQKLKQQIGAILGGSNRLTVLTELMALLGNVHQQEKAVEMARLLEEGDKHMSGGDFREAYLAYDRVAVGIAAFPYQFDWGKLPSEVDAKKLAAQGKMREAEIKKDALERDIAQQRQQERAVMEEDVLRHKVDTIISRAREAFERKLYRRAAAEAYNAYELDRRREDARSLYLEARRLAHVQFDDDYREERLERLARVHENIHAMMIPQTELLVFPEDWFRRSLRTADSLVEAEEEVWRRELANRLKQEITFTWDGNSLLEVVDFLRRTTGVNYVIASDVESDTGIPPLTLKGTMRLETALDWISELTDVQITQRNEALFFSKQGAVKGDLAVRMYNITDLITPVTNFPGPELAYNASGGGGGGGFDLFGGGGGDGAEAEASITPEDVEDMIKNSVLPDSWDDEGVAITFREGTKTMFITQRPEVHTEIHRLLDHLRGQSSLSVHAQIRVLDVKKAFVEEIGVEWNDFAPADVATNPFTSQGTFRVQPEWSASTNTRNFLPANASSSGFNNSFGQGFRMRWIHSNSAASLFDLHTINGILTAMEQEGDSTTLNAPELTAFNGTRANASFIRQYAYISDYDVGGSGNYDPVISVLNYGDIIDITPLVSADRKYVTLEVRPSSVTLEDVFTENITAVSNQNGGLIISGYPLELPTVEVRTLRSTVTLPDKGSLMIGGFVRGLRQRAHSGIPFLSHIPFLGRLFSKNGIYDENRHLMYMVTVTILSTVDEEAKQ